MIFSAVLLSFTPFSLIASFDFHVTIIVMRWIAVSFVGLLCIGIIAIADNQATRPIPAASPTVDPLPETVQFNRDIRPILAENCFSCHSGDRHKSGLRLDKLPDALAKAKSGKPAIVPGHPDQSELIARITSTDEDMKMPPPDSQHDLTAAQISLLTRWIQQGAAFQKHWAFVPPTKPALPAVHKGDWTRNPIDQFILSKLESEKLIPSPEADKINLLRRLYLDLIGLPPSPADVERYMADKSENAYEKQVDLLLANLHYGERQAQHWLDIARYADSNGYQRDKLRILWPYRDYVINAFNRDMPFDQFIIEQIAGDQLPFATQDQIVATGFLRSSMMNDEGGVDPEEFRLAATFDRLQTISSGVLGLTIQCAQCHAHKTDPFSQEEYYRLFAFLNDAYDSQPLVYTPDEQNQIAKIKLGIAAVEKQLQKDHANWPEQMQQWEKKMTDSQVHWIPIPLEYTGDPGEHWYVKLRDHSQIATPCAPRTDASFTWTGATSGITAVQLELLTDPTLPAMGPGYSPVGVCALTEFNVEVASASDPENKSPVKIIAASSDINPEISPLPDIFNEGMHFDGLAGRTLGPVSFAIDANPQTAWSIDAGPGARNQNRKAVFVFEKPVAVAAVAFPKVSGNIFTFHLHQNHGGPAGDDRTNQNLGRFRISVTTDANEKDQPIVADPLPARIRSLIKLPANRRTPNQISEIFGVFRKTLPQWKSENAAIVELQKQWPAGTTTLAFSPLPEPRPTYLLKRGEIRAPAGKVAADVPAILHSLPKEFEPTRLTLAQWLVDRNSPTTARTYVNRQWQYLFGTGLVGSSDDLGITGDAPVNGDLLDWLACELMESKWSTKRLMRLIVTSATYRQSSHCSPELFSRDPANRLCARATRFRVDAETVRDIALSSSGLLKDTVGGRSVMPPAPAYLFRPPASFATFPWIDETDTEKFRRGIYVLHRRSTVYPMLQAFDKPDAIASCTRRNRANTALQALITLNEPTSFACAQALAKRAREELASGTDMDRITCCFQAVLARKPSPPEMEELLNLYEKQRNRNMQNAKDAFDPLVLVARVILNLDEAITRE